MEDVENIEESDFEEYRMEVDVWFEEDSDVGTSNLFKDLDLASTEHVSYTPMKSANATPGSRSLVWEYETSERIPLFHLLLCVDNSYQVSLYPISRCKRVRSESPVRFTRKRTKGVV
ncbi:hypothetical protein LguiB_006081 [Lonicera macranthoides]